jgi:hypothetical protein
VALTIVWAVWAGWSLIGRATPYQLRVLDDLGAPIAEAVAEVDGKQVGTSGTDGFITAEWRPSATVLEVSAPGHIPQRLTIAERPEAVVDVVLKARVLRGQVVDPDGRAVEGVQIVAGPAAGVSDEEGHFSLRGAERGTVLVQRPAWLATEFSWDGGPGETVVEITPFTARAVHVTGEAVRDRFDEFIELARTTELNALMIDLKDETGLIWYGTTNPVALEVGADFTVYDLREVVAQAHAEGLYVIGRLVVFNDPVAALRKPSLAVWDSSADAPYNARGQYFLDPTDPEARQYGLDLAVEACAMGVDEIQFDYVRFPDVRSESAVFDGGVSQDVRIATITGFLSDAVDLLHPLGCAVAADIFGFITRAVDDGGIGQRWEDVAQVVDVVSPMVYPSHYDPGWYGFDDPNAYPGPMVQRALEDAMARLPRSVVVRPWLQDFGYNSDQVRAQIVSAEEYGLGWMLWNAESNITTDALMPED